jgi:hypothetical protein
MIPYISNAYDYSVIDVYALDLWLFVFCVDGFKIFEMNARFTGITGLRALMGFNEVAICIEKWLKIENITELLRNFSLKVNGSNLHNFILERIELSLKVWLFSLHNAELNQLFTDLGHLVSYVADVTKL